MKLKLHTAEAGGIFVFHESLKPGENEMKTFSGKNSIQNRSEATARKREDVVSLKSQQPTLWRAVASLLF